MPRDPRATRAAQLARWRANLADVTAIDELADRRPATCAGVVRAIRLVPGRSLEISIEDGSGRLTAVWSGRPRLPGVELGVGLRLTGTVARDRRGALVMRNPDWALVAEPYA